MVSLWIPRRPVRCEEHDQPGHTGNVSQPEPQRPALTDATIAAARAVGLRDLVAFVVVAEELGVGQAARRLNEDRSATGKALNRLEKVCRTSLVDTTTRSLRLTDAGRRMLPHARSLVEAASRLVGRVRQTPNPSATTATATPGSAGTVLLDTQTPPDTETTIVLP